MWCTWACGGFVSSGQGCARLLIVITMKPAVWMLAKWRHLRVCSLCQITMWHMWPFFWTIWSFQLLERIFFYPHWPHYYVFKTMFLPLRSVDSLFLSQFIKSWDPEQLELVCGELVQNFRWHSEPLPFKSGPLEFPRHSFTIIIGQNAVLCQCEID